MCIAAPGIVKSISRREALVEYPGITQKAMIGIKDVKVGDSVLVQMGIIIQVISKNESLDLQSSWESKSS